MVSRKTSECVWGVTLLALNLTFNSDEIPGLSMTYDGFAVNHSRAGILLQFNFVCRSSFGELLYLFIYLFILFFILFYLFIFYFFFIFFFFHAISSSPVP